MALDENLKAPTLFEVAIPDGFLSSHFYYRPVMGTLLSRYRPMDKVKIGMDEPQEDEYAIYRLTDFSPLEELVFPSTGSYFLKNCTSFLPDENSREAWESDMMNFYRKLVFKSGKTLISKNPFNSLRIKTLTRLFPEARFIHIVRHPYEVVPSTIHMWKILQKQNCLNKNNCSPASSDVTEVLDRVLTSVRSDLPSAGRQIEIKYEDFITEPIIMLRRIYKEIGLEFTKKFEDKVRDYLFHNEDYEKNAFSLTGEEKKNIAERLKAHMDYFGYTA